MDLSTLKPEDFSLTEELTRWRLELEVKSAERWWIAFTNPTAGPWKRLMGRTLGGLEGEVHRFEREEDRPDLVLVSDTARMVAIVEAKDTLPKLLDRSQVTKSIAVVRSLGGLLSKKGTNAYWGKRSEYELLAGLCWGAETPSTDDEAAAALATYQAQMGQVAVFGVEVVKEAKGTLVCAEIWATTPRTTKANRVCADLRQVKKAER